ncbi:MAG: hypothetical protein PHE88_10235 [Elusimicrobia bacterium]|nr:hypothetical protein [Elusimicrobiota bacterium]
MPARFLYSDIKVSSLIIDIIDVIFTSVTITGVFCLYIIFGINTSGNGSPNSSGEERTICFPLVSFEHKNTITYKLITLSGKKWAGTEVFFGGRYFCMSALSFSLIGAGTDVLQEFFGGRYFDRPVSALLTNNQLPNTNVIANEVKQSKNEIATDFVLAMTNKTQITSGNGSPNSSGEERTICFPLVSFEHKNIRTNEHVNAVAVSGAGTDVLQEFFGGRYFDRPVSALLNRRLHRLLEQIMQITSGNGSPNSSGEERTICFPLVSLTNNHEHKNTRTNEHVNAVINFAGGYGCPSKNSLGEDILAGSVPSAAYNLRVGTKVLLSLAKFAIGGNFFGGRNVTSAHPLRYII